MPDRPVRILYIDDDPALARLMQRALARRGFQVEHAANAEEGLARLAEGALEAIDAIALDHHLPTGTGLDVLARLATLDEPPPVVYVTGSAEAAIAVAALKAGAADYVVKSVGDDFVELLGSAIGQAIRKGRLEREKFRAEREVREARDLAEMMLGEVNHRVANSLALVASMVRMQAGALDDAVARQALEETQARISAIAGIHRRLYTSNDVRFVEIDEYLKSMIGELDVSMTAVGGRSQILLDVEPLAVPTDKAVSIGVIVTELVTNAVKYAYEAGEEGEVRVAFRRHGADGVVLAVEDDGVGWTGEGTIKGSGLGSRIVKAMALNLGTSLVYVPAEKGTRAELDISLS